MNEVSGPDRRPASGQAAADRTRDWGAQSAVAPLRRAILSPPNWTEAGARRVAGSADLARWGYTAPPDLGKARAEHEALAAVLAGAGVEVIEHTAAPEGAQDGAFDTVFACDRGFALDGGAVIFRAGKPERRPEADIAEAAFREAGVPILYRMQAPATAEGGDMLWLRPDLLLVGRTYRTNPDGHAALGSLLEPRGVRAVSAPVPHFRGPGSVMHLLSVISLIDSDLAVVYLPLLAVETVGGAEGLLRSGAPIDPVRGPGAPSRCRHRARVFQTILYLRWAIPPGRWRKEETSGIFRWATRYTTLL